MRKITILALVFTFMLFTACSGANTSNDETSQMVIVPNLNGMSMEQAFEIIEDSGLRVGDIIYVKDKDLADSTIVKQNPAAETKAEEKSAIELTVVDNKSD